MKTRDITTVALIASLFAASCEESYQPVPLTYEIGAEIMNMERPEDAYNYPVYPGTDAWAELHTGEEMLKACQVPEKVLKNMSTQGVIQALWEYPLLIDAFHRHQYQLDFKSMFSQNNAYKALCKRKDAGTSLLERIMAVNPLYAEPQSRFKFELLEMLAAQDIFLSQLDRKSKVLLVKTVLEKDNCRQNANFDDRMEERVITWLLAGKVMLNANYAPFVSEVNGNEALALFFTSDSYTYMDFVYGNIPQIIAKHANRFI
jgi:hypothetical protein